MAQAQMEAARMAAPDEADQLTILQPVVQQPSVTANASGKIVPMPSKVLDTKNLSEAEIQNDPILKKLREADINGDGVYSTDEVMRVCKELNESNHAKEAATMMVRKLAIFAAVLGFLLVISMIGNFCSTLWAIYASKEENVPDTSGIALTRPQNSNSPPTPVGTSSVKVLTPGISGLKESTKEELDSLEQISFFHDGGYHKIRASQVHRYDGRVEIWGSPVGIVVVEDTGEVHYAPFGVPSLAFDNCFGENATNMTNETELICGESVDNEPPSNLEVEDPQEEDPDNAPAPAGSEGRRLARIDENGEAVWDEFDEDNEYHAEARRLSSRRRFSGGGSRRRSSSSSSFSSRRRSGQSYSSRRRASGSYTGGSTNYASGNARRRAAVVSTPRRRAVSTVSTASDGRRRVVQNVDGTQRRRYPNYYNTPSDSRRRDIGAGHVAAAGIGGAAVGGVGGYAYGSSQNNQYSSGYGSGSSVSANSQQVSQQYYASGGGTPIRNSGTSGYSTDACPTNMEVKCEDDRCWCEDKPSSGKTAWIVIGICGIIFFCCCLGMMAYAANNQ